MRARLVGIVALGALALSCHAAPPAPSTSPAATGGIAARPTAARYDPAHDLGPLFRDVQTARVFADSKTFVDARPLRPPAEIAARYVAERDGAGFSLRAFVERNF